VPAKPYNYMTVLLSRTDFLRTSRPTKKHWFSGSQITGSTDNYAGFTDTHAIPKTIQGFMTMYEISECATIMADATSYRKSKMAAG